MVFVEQWNFPICRENFLRERHKSEIHAQRVRLHCVLILVQIIHMPFFMSGALSFFLRCNRAQA